MELSVRKAKADTAWAMHAGLGTIYTSLAEEVNEMTSSEFVKNLKRVKGPDGKQWQSVLRGIIIPWASVYFF